MVDVPRSIPPVTSKRCGSSPKLNAITMWPRRTPSTPVFVIGLDLHCVEVERAQGGSLAVEAQQITVEVAQ
jgi:hypothetical protein